MKQLHIFYLGHVQGVGFRYTAQKTAKQFNLTGWVRNRRDGRVEFLAEGDEQTLNAFISVMQNGPLGPHIRHSETSWQDAKDEFSSFIIRATA